MSAQVLKMHPRSLTFVCLFLAFTALAPIGAAVALLSNAIWLVPVVVIGGELLVYRHQRHIGIVIDDSHKSLIVQNFYLRYVIPYTSIVRICPGPGRWGTPAHNFLATARGAGSSINIVYRAADGSERVVAPMASSAASVTAPRPSPMTEGLAALCQRRSIECDLSQFGQPEPPAAPVAPVDEPAAPPSEPRPTSLFYVNGHGLKRPYAIASVVLFVGGFASTAVLQSGFVFLAAGLAGLGLQVLGRE